jgi:predicted nuclease of predicted toxin-antitoxin system
MRILFDHNTPAPLRRCLDSHDVETAYERGWAELTNGDLLMAAESAGFELLITTDRSIRYQQNLIGRKLALLVLSTNDWTHIRKFQASVVSAVSSIQSGGYVEIVVPIA